MNHSNNKNYGQTLGDRGARSPPIDWAKQNAVPLNLKFSAINDDLASNWLNYLTMPAGPVLCSIQLHYCSLLKAASDVISGMFVSHIVAPACLRRYFTLSFHDDFRRQVAGDVIYGAIAE